MDTWIPGRRIVKDLDLLGLGTLKEADEGIQALCATTCETAESDSFAIVAVETTWEETPSPGLRYQLGPQPLQIDVATGDPLVVPPRRIDVEGTTALCCTPEIMYGWKAHGLFERGEGKWRARDLWDLYLLQTCLDLDAQILNSAVAMAFTSRNCGFDVTRRFFGNDWGRSRGSQKKWARFRQEAGFQADVTADLFTVKDAVAATLRVILDSIPHKR